MRFDDLVRTTADLPVIESKTLLALGEKSGPLSVQLNRWVRSGRLLQLRRGVYLLPEHLRRSRASAETIANLLVTPSYVSLERALSIHGLIPERVARVQSVTTARAAVFTTPAGTFEYRHINPRFFFGYEEMSVGGGAALVARPEKALLDLFYLSPGNLTRERVRALRLQELERLDLAVLQALAERSTSARLARAVLWVGELARET